MIFRVLVQKSYSVIVQTDNAVLAEKAALNAVGGHPSEKSHIFDTVTRVESIAKMEMGEEEDL